MKLKKVLSMVCVFAMVFSLHCTVDAAENWLMAPEDFQTVMSQPGHQR